MVAAAAVVSANQQRSHKWWMSDEGKAELGLTEQQSAEIEAIFQESLPRLRATKNELDREEQVLSGLIETSRDEAQVVQQIERVEAARSEMSKTRTLMLFRMHQVLSTQQRAKLKAMYERRDRDRGRDKRH
jgi:Spy/CpxP family protein refolding chaperone